MLTEEQVRALRKASEVLCGTGYHDEASVINSILTASAPTPNVPTAPAQGEHDCGCATNQACAMKTDGSCWRAD